MTRPPVGRPPGQRLLAWVGFVGVLGFTLYTLLVDVGFFQQLDRRGLAVHAPTVFWLLRFGLLPLSSVLAGVALWRTARGGSVYGWYLGVSAVLLVPLLAARRTWGLVPYLVLSALYLLMAYLEGRRLDEGRRGKKEG